MHKWFFILFLVGCSTHVPPIIYGPTPVSPVPTPMPVIIDTTASAIDTTQFAFNGEISVKYFGAKGDGISDDYIPIQNACNYCIVHPWVCSTVGIPIGHYRSSQSIKLSNHGKFFTVRLQGDVSNKSASDPYLSQITFDNIAGYCIGIQLGRSIEIENLTLIGKYGFPNTVNNQNIGTLKFSDWADGSVVDSRYAPYAGISIDPEANASGSRGGTSDVTIKNCAIKQFMVGICLTPNASTLNDEIANILEDDIEACRVAIAIGQDQSKTINIKGLKVWASVHTIIDGISYGRGTGGGSLFCENWNVAGNVNELFNLSTTTFPLSCKDIYSESLFRFGYVGNGAGTNCLNCQIDFLSGPGWPAPDYLIAGQINFSGGMLRYYDNSQTHRMNLSNVSGAFRDMTMNVQPLVIGLYGSPNPQPTFDNVHNYYGNGFINPHDTLIYFHTTPTLIIDRINWIGSVVVPDLVAKQSAIGDYIIAQPASWGRGAYDPYLNAQNLNTIQIGRITSISGDTLKLDDIGINTYSGSGYDLMFLGKIVH